jgi:predicted transcriptional regulator
MDKSKQKILRVLGYLVRQRRTELGISQEELGLRANLDRTYISGVERGVRNPSLTALVRGTMRFCEVRQEAEGRRQEARDRRVLRLNLLNA